MKLSIGVPFLAAAVVAGWSLVSCGGSDKPPATQAAAPTALSTPVAAAPTNSTSTPATAATPATSPAAAATQTVPPTPVTATEAPASTPTPLTPTPTQPPAPTTAPPTQSAPPLPTATPTQPPVPTPTEAPPPTPTPQPVPGISVGVRDNNLFSPRTATVGVGGTVTWVWQGTAYHDIFSRDFPSDPAGVKQTGSYSFTFTRPGTYSYTCEVHDSAGMRGTIIVQ